MSPNPASRLPGIVPVLAALPFVTLSAAPLKVDISNSGRQLAEGLDPNFTPWATDYAWFPGGDSTSATFDGVTIRFTRTGSGGTALRPAYWKAGVQSQEYDIRLTADGIMVEEGDAGAQIEMRLTGLTPGPHTLLLYLNNWDGNSSLPAAPLDISVDGSPVVNDLAVSTRVTDNSDATTAYLQFDASAGQDVVVLIAAETGGSYTSRNVRINGFEIDTENTKDLASSPLPADGDIHVDADSGSLVLGWTAASAGADSHDVYFGTDAAAVAAATPASPEFMGNQAGTNFPLDDLDSRQPYFWRVDQIRGGSVFQGNVWTFRPRRLAFPGAEGYGRYAQGGRGGVVVKVTNLNDSGPGSLRDAVLGDYGPRTVVFDVGGLITLQDDIIIGTDDPFITIAGQTAPGKGICIKREQLAMSGANDVIMRFVRGLVGKESGTTQNATGMAGVDHCIMDHCSFGWGIDEGLSTRGAKNLTFQRCNLSEALNIAGHDNYGGGTRHGYAASVGGDVASLHHNLLAHNEGRNWSMAGGLDGDGFYAGRLDIFNNVVYNWRGRTTDGGAHEVNFVSNYYKKGPAGGINTLLNPQYGGFPGKQQYYMVGNIRQDGSSLQTNQSALFDLRTENGGTVPADSNPPYSATVNAPFFPSHATIHTARNAYKQVTSDVGCNLPMIDERDTRIIGETLAGTATYTGSLSGSPGLPDTTNDVNGWEDYGNHVRPSGWDDDNDGMPAWWEEIHGLDPASVGFDEANADPDGDGYTHLEDYLNWIANPNFLCEGGQTVDIDLHALCRGYLATNPSFAFSGESNGSVALVGGRYARFTPSTASDALGAFTFTVTDSTGDSMTREIGVHITASETELPELTLLASDDAGGEFGDDPAIAFTITRSGDSGAALDVPLTASGSATAGADYSGFIGSARIAAGETSATVALTVLADDLAEGTETVTLDFGTSGDFTVGEPASASASVLDKPSQDEWFHTVPDSALRGAEDDGDGDHMVNAIEYFMGTDAGDPASHGVLSVAPDASGDFRVRFPMADGRVDVDHGIEWTTTLDAWFASGDSDGERRITFSSPVPVAGAAESNLVEVTGTISDGPAPTALFLRLVVVSP